MNEKSLDDVEAYEVSGNYKSNRSRYILKMNEKWKNMSIKERVNEINKKFCDDTYTAKNLARFYKRHNIKLELPK